MVVHLATVVACGAVRGRTDATRVSGPATIALGEKKGVISIHARKGHMIGRKGSVTHLFAFTTRPPGRLELLDGHG
jgi:hypothetical protein